MKVRLIILLLSLNWMSTLWATPEKITVFFLSEQKRATLLEFIENKKRISFSEKLTFADVNCVPMGDGCFHPQIGYIEDRPATLQPLPQEEPTELKTFNSHHVDLIQCREGNYFDIFCGRASEPLEGRSTELELWFDISTSLRKNDFSRDFAHCERRSFAEAIINRCSKPPVVAVYNTGLKEIQQMSQICHLSGGNSTQRTIDWIRASRTKHLVMVTDTEEFTPQFRDFLNRENAKIYGIDDGRLVVEQLMSHVERLSQYCQ